MVSQFFSHDFIAAVTLAHPVTSLSGVKIDICSIAYIISGCMVPHGVKRDQMVLIIGADSAGHSIHNFSMMFLDGTITA